MIFLYISLLKFLLHSELTQIAVITQLDAPGMGYWIYPKLLFHNGPFLSMLLKPSNVFNVLKSECFKNQAYRNIINKESKARGYGSL